MQNDINYKNELDNMEMNDAKIYSVKGYHDPDGFPEEYDYVFYDEYCKCLQNHYKKIKDRIGLDGLSFYNVKKPLKKKNMGIFLKKDKITLQLKSDQFGFSAVYNKDRIYPYRAYLESSKGNIEIANKIFGKNGWINRTRQVGGSFLWPIESCGVTPYNNARGGSLKYDKGNSKFYIQDRVDLTLYEVKEVYENKLEKVQGNILSNYLYKNDNNKTKMYVFLNLFGDFETFCEVFGFWGSFVSEEGNVINIFKTDEDNNKYITPTYMEKARKDGLIKTDTKALDFENMFNLIVDLIKKRREKLGYEE